MKVSKVSRLQAMRTRRALVEHDLAGPLIEERDRATSWARQAESRGRSDEERRKMAERLFATDIGKHGSQEMQHWIAKEISQHAMRAAVATVNQTMENGDYVIHIRVPELNIQRRFARRSVDDARPGRHPLMLADEMTIQGVSIDTAKLRKTR